MNLLPFILGQIGQGMGYYPVSQYSAWQGSGWGVGGLVTGIIGPLILAKVGVFGKRIEAEAANANAADAFVRERFKQMLDDALASRDAKIRVLENQVEKLEVALAEKSKEKHLALNAEVACKAALSDARQIARHNYRAGMAWREKAELLAAKAKIASTEG